MGYFCSPLEKWGNRSKNKSSLKDWKQQRKQGLRAKNEKGFKRSKYYTIRFDKFFFFERKYYSQIRQNIYNGEFDHGSG